MNESQTRRTLKVPKTPDNVFGKRLKEIRTQVLGLSNVEQLAPLIGVSVRTVEGYEQGSSLPSGETPWRLLALLGPDLFSSLMPHVQAPQTVTLELVEAREGEARRVDLSTIGGTTRAERLRAMIALAQEVLDEET